MNRTQSLPSKGLTAWWEVSIHQVGQKQIPHKVMSSEQSAVGGQRQYLLSLSKKCRKTLPKRCYLKQALKNKAEVFGKERSKFDKYILLGIYPFELSMGQSTEVQMDVPAQSSGNSFYSSTYSACQHRNTHGSQDSSKPHQQSSVGWIREWEPARR